MMYKDDVADMFEQIYQKVKQEDFLQMTSLNGEIPFWIVSYNPEQEVEIAKAYGGLLKKLERKGVEVLDINLYTVAMQILDDNIYYSDSMLINGEGKWSLRRRSSKEIALTLFFEKMSVMNKSTAKEKGIKPNNYTVSIQGTKKIMFYTPAWVIYISDGEGLNSFRFYKIDEK